MKHKNLNDVVDADRADIRYNRTHQREKWIDFGNENHEDTPCYHTHPPLRMPNSDLVIYGGSCSSPIMTDADIYIGLCHTMRQTERRFPWGLGEEIYFPIPDMGVPKDVENFKQLVKWVKSRLEFNLKIHVGCIGGHGRTGTLLAALVSLYGEKDAITYVRNHYCPKAVESKVQVQFLTQHFGIIPAEERKDKNYSLQHHQLRPVEQTKNGLITISPIESTMAIWT